MEHFDASPSAASLIEGLRDFGYSFNTASADIIDNSIAAKATVIEVLATFGQGSPKIAFVDNGAGMDPQALRIAMKPGSFSPKESRAKHDLGRFGLGLKTASFSQCRLLTVVTRSNGVTSVARWDLDEVARTDRWVVLVPDLDEIEIFGLDRLRDDHGTLVLWEHIDRMGVDGDDKDSQSHFEERLAGLREHLGLVFHRFIEGQADKHEKVSVILNGLSIDPLNPFNPRNQRTDAKPPEMLRNGAKVQPFVLPHPNSVDPSEWRAFEGVAGYVNSQGFYLYRVDRLIVWATWFGLARKSPSTKLLRVAIDIDNESDENWQINVLKASANLPRQTKKELRTFIERWRLGARSTFSKRNVTANAATGLRLWRRVESDEKIRYEIDESSQFIRETLANFDDKQREQVRKLLAVIASDLPLDQLFVDLSDNQERVDVDVLGLDNALELARTVIQRCKADKLDAKTINDVLASLPMLEIYLDEIGLKFEKELQ